MTVAQATDDTLPGASVKDTATVSGLTANATGTVTFKLYSDDTCSTTVTTLGPIAIGTVTNGTATVHSGAFDGLVNAGTYYFIASYQGDANNKYVSGKCGDDNESVTIKPGQPTIVTVAQATDDTLPGASVSDTATVSGLTANATGTVTFKLYSDSDCATASHNGYRCRDGDQRHRHGALGRVRRPGERRDVLLHRVLPGRCQQQERLRQVRRRQRVRDDQAGSAVDLDGRDAADDTLPGSSVKDTATVSGLTANATGSVTFRLYSDASCAT